MRGPEQSQMMIQPEDIRRKAENLYPDYLRAWLDGEGKFFPRVIPARRTLDGDNFSVAIQSVRRLREESKEVTGFGYTVQWQEVNSRKFGRNQFPARIVFETPGDFLRFTGKQREFSVFQDAVTRLREAFPPLEKWIRSNVRALIDAAPDLDGLLSVLQFFYKNPRPDRFARELPLPVDTKFIERYQGILRSGSTSCCLRTRSGRMKSTSSAATAYAMPSHTFLCDCWTPPWCKNSACLARSFPSRCTRWERCPCALLLPSLSKTRSTCLRSPSFPAVLGWAG